MARKHGMSILNIERCLAAESSNSKLCVFERRKLKRTRGHTKYVVGPRCVEGRGVLSYFYSYLNNITPSTQRGVGGWNGRMIAFFAKCFRHVQTSDNVRVHSATQCTASCTYFTHVPTCDNVRVHSATQWTAF